MIEQSLAKQYGVLPSEQESLHYSDWAKMVGGLMDDTPLGRVIAIRSENDRDVLSRMSPDQQQIRADWFAFRASARTPADEKERQKQLQAMIAGLFGR